MDAPMVEFTAALFTSDLDKLSALLDKGSMLTNSHQAAIQLLQHASRIPSSKLASFGR